MLALRKMLNKLGHRLVDATAEPSQSLYRDNKPETILGLELKGGSSSWPSYGRVEARRVSEHEWSVSFGQNYGGAKNHGVLPFADALRKMHEVHTAQKAMKRDNPHPNEPKNFWVIEESLLTAPANNLYKVACRYGVELEGAPEVKLAAHSSAQTHPRAAA